MPDNCHIFQMAPREYEHYTLFDAQHPHAVLWQQQIMSGNRVRFIYREDAAPLAQGDLVRDYGSRNRGDETDYTIAGRRIYLSRLVVKETERGRGIGSALVKHLCNVAKEWGYAEISLGVDLDNLPARALYAKQGFTTVLYTGEDEAGKYEKLLKYL